MAMQLAKSGITIASNLAWIDLPPGMGGGSPIAGSESLYVGTLVLQHGEGFGFHYHAKQDEWIYVTEGEIEGWAGQSTATLTPGDLICAPAGTVHALFNTSATAATLLIVLSPLVAGVPEEMEVIDGYGWDMTDVSGDEPWASMR